MIEILLEMPIDGRTATSVVPFVDWQLSSSRAGPVLAGSV
jgi:hypothetical protein